MKRCRYHVHQQMQLVPFERTYMQMTGRIQRIEAKLYRCPIPGCPDVKCAESESGEVLKWYERRHKTGMARYEEETDADV